MTNTGNLIHELEVTESIFKEILTKTKGACGECDANWCKFQTLNVCERFRKKAHSLTYVN